MELKKDKEQQAVSYHGKKAYYVSPSIVRKSAAPRKKEQLFLFEDIEEDIDN